MEAFTSSVLSQSSADNGTLLEQPELSRPSEANFRRMSRWESSFLDTEKIYCPKIENLIEYSLRLIIMTIDYELIN